MQHFNSSTHKKLVEPYCSINVLPLDLDGWFENQEQLKKILNSTPIHTVIEIGSWLGMSTCFIAQHLHEKAKLYAVDTWLGSSDEILHIYDPRLPYLYQLFLSNVIHEKLHDKIIPLRMNSLEAAKALNLKADLIYLDAAHDTDSVYNDIMAWYPHLNEGGIFCGDDWTWSTTREGVTKAAAVLQKNIIPDRKFWSFE